MHIKNYKKMEVLGLKKGDLFISKQQACRKAGMIFWEVKSVIIEISDTEIVYQLLEDCYDELLNCIYMAKGTTCHAMNSHYFINRIYKTAA